MSAIPLAFILAQNPGAEQASAAELLAWQRRIARRADAMVRRAGEDDRSLWQRAEQEVFGFVASPQPSPGASG